MTIKVCVSVLCGEKHKASINQSGHRQVTGCNQPAAVMSLVFMVHTVVNSSDLRPTLDWIKEEEKNRVGSLFVLSHTLPERRRQTNERLIWSCLICSLQVLCCCFPKHLDAKCTEANVDCDPKRCDWCDFYGSSKWLNMKRMKWPSESQSSTSEGASNWNRNTASALEDKCEHVVGGSVTQNAKGENHLGIKLL